MLIIALGQEINRDIFSIFLNVKVCCVFSLESLMSTYNIHCQYRKENRPKLSQICSFGICSKGLKKEFETAVVTCDEP